MKTNTNSLHAWARTTRDEMIDWRDLWRTLPERYIHDIANDLSAETRAWLLAARGQADLALVFEALSSVSIFGESAR